MRSYRWASGILLGIFLITAFFSVSLPVYADNIPQSLIVPDGIVTNGGVYSLAKGPDGLVYIGGTFTQIGPSRPFGAIFSTSTSALLSSLMPKPDGAIEVALADGQGGWYIAGSFNKIGSVSIKGIAHINSDYSLDTDFNLGSSSFILTMYLDGQTLYVGGQNAMTIGGQTRSSAAAIDVNLSSPNYGLATSWNPVINNRVNIIKAYNGVVYIGGSFTSAGGQVRNRLAALSASTGLATSWDPNLNNEVNDIEFNSTTAYVAGYFSTIGGLSRVYLGAIDLTTGVATSWVSNSIDAAPSTILLNGTNLYVGGSFLNLGGASRRCLGAVNTGVSGNNALNWNPGVTGVCGIKGLSLSGTTLYTVGTFTQIGGQGRTYAAALNTAVDTGNLLSWNPTVSGEVRAIALEGSSAFLGGDFTIVNGVSRNRLASFDPSTRNITAWDPNLNNQVIVLNFNGTTLYAGGTFTLAGGQTRYRIAAFDTTTGSILSWSPITNGAITAIASNATTVFAGGDFTSLGGQTRNKLGSVSASTGLATGWNPNVGNLSVDALAIGSDGQKIYVGGDFTTISGQTRNRLAAFNISDGSLLSWNPNASSSVRVIIPHSSGVYVGGDFTSVGGQSRRYIAKLDSNTGLATAWNPGIISGSNVYGLSIYGNTIYVGGRFGDIGGQTRNALAAISLASDTSNVTTWNPAPTGVYVFAVLADTGYVYAGGDFTAISGEPSSNFAQFSMVPPQQSSVSVSALVPPEISFTLSPSFCSLGVLSESTIKTCSFTINVNTNSGSGYVASISDQNGGSMTSEASTIASYTGTLNNGTQGFGVSTNNTSLGLGVDYSAICEDGLTMVTSSISAISKSFASSNNPVQNSSTTLCLGAAISGLTPAGNYSDIAVITVTGTF